MSAPPAPATGERVLAAIAARLDDRTLERAFGHRLALRKIFEEMAAAFEPAVANGLVGDVVYRLRRSNGKVKPWTVHITPTAATATRGAAREPMVVLTLDVADFIRLAAGEHDPMRLLVTGRMEVSGDAMVAGRLGPMFGRPAPPDRLAGATALTYRERKGDRSRGPVEERTVRVDGKNVFFAAAGDGPALVLLHGGGPGASGVANYSRNIHELATRFRVIVPDLPGYGRSSKGVDPDDPFGYLADTIRGLLDTLGLERPHLVGNSYGGACALRLALDTPDRVDRLVLMGPGGIGTTRGLPTEGLNRLLSYYGGAGPSREKLETFVRDCLVHDGAAIPDDLIDARYQASIDPKVVADPPLRRPSGIRAPRTLWRMDFTRDRRLATLQTPTLVLWGADDKVNRPSGGPRLATAMPNCRLIVVPDTGHWVQWEQADLFNDEVQQFCS